MSDLETPEYPVTIKLGKEETVIAFVSVNGYLITELGSGNWFYGPGILDDYDDVGSAAWRTRRKLRTMSLETAQRVCLALKARMAERGQDSSKIVVVSAEETFIVVPPAAAADSSATAPRKP